MDYDSWKTMNPHENTGISNEDYRITLEVSIDADKMSEWSGCKLSNVVIDDEIATFNVSYIDSIQIGKYDSEDDIEEGVKDSAHSFVEGHGGAGWYEVVGYAKQQLNFNK
jgi:hypothetical protein